jgi:rhodanese-related sulfurtransferase
MVAGSGQDINRITARELRTRLCQGEKIAVLDVRRQEAWAAEPASIPGAIWVPLEEVPQRARDLPADTRLVIYCS